MTEKEFLGNNMKLFIQIAYNQSCRWEDNRTGNEYLYPLENVVKLLMEDWLPDGDEIYQDDKAPMLHTMLQQCCNEF
ncbi:hypothetical protein TNCV_4226721 [Trichonephila clavipes]|nr:hypothetical protein TNCV_4226721 [Trichonephila clavipes]